MKITGVVVMAAVVVAGACAASRMPERERVVVVCTDSGNALQAVYGAQQQASKLFAGIGVRIEWHSTASCPSSAPMIRISFSEQTPETQSPGALAYALPYEGTHIVVFHDRVKHIRAAMGVPQLLAYVMVHEITHILQNVNGHSATGIMKARWDNNEYFEMGSGRLSFTEQDIRLIHLGMDARQARSADASLIAAR